MNTASTVDHPQPLVTVAVPTRNDAATIEACLRSLQANDHSDLALLVVDAMSCDGTREIVSRLAAADSRVSLIDNPRGELAAMNVAVDRCHSAYLMFANSRATYSGDYVSTLVRDLHDHNADLAAGALQPSRPPHLMAAAIAEVLGHWFGLGNALHRRTTDRSVREVAEVAPGMFRREIFQRVGVFNERLPRMQAREFAARLRANGGRILLDSRIRAAAETPGSAAAYLRWIFLGAFHLFNARRFTDTSLAKPRNLIPFLFGTYLCLVAAGCFQLPPSGLLAAGFPVVCYALATVALSVQIAWAERRPALGLLCGALFPLTHLSYALGTVVGGLTGWLGPRRLASASAIPACHRPPSIAVSSPEPHC